MLSCKAFFRKGCLVNRNLGAYVQLSAAMVIVGSNVVVSKIITSGFPVFLASAVRFAIATSIMLPMLIRAEHGFPAIKRRDMLILFLQSFAGNFLFSVLLLYGLRLTGVAESGIITGTTPAVTGLVSFLLLKEKMTWNKGAGILVATLGVVILNIVGNAPGSGQGSNPVLGNLLVFGAVIGEAVWTILGKAASGRVAALTGASVTSALGMLMFLPFALYDAGSFAFAAVPLVNWLPLLYYGVVGTVGAYLLWYRSLPRVSTSIAGVFIGLLPVSATILSYIVLKEPFLWTHLMGMLCVLLAIVLVTWRPPQIVEKEFAQRG